MSLIHWWPLNGDTQDKVGLNHLTNTGVTFTTEGKIGQAAVFDNDYDILKANNLAELSALNQYSMSCWVYLSSRATNHSSAFLSSGNWNESDKQVCFGVYSYSSGYGTLLVPNKNAWSTGINISKNRIVLNQWYHIAITYNGAKTDAYINGNYVGTYAGGGINSNTVGYYYLGGATYYGGFTMKGRLNDFRIYDHALSVKEVKELSKALMVHYTFNDVANEATTNLIYNQYKGYSSSFTKLTETFNGMEVYKNIVTNPYTGTDRDNAGFCHKTTIPHTQEQAKQPYFQLSFWKRLNQSYGINIVGYIKVKYTDDTIGQHNWSYSKSNWGTDTNSIGKWEYITAKATLYTGKTVKEITSFYVYGRNTTGGDCDFAGIQLEAKDHPTPYVEGSRTGLLFNEAGYNNPISFQNLELTSDTISGSYAGIFDSSRPTQIRTALDLGGSTDVTVGCWLYPKSGSSAFTDNALYCVLNGTAIHLYAYGRSDTWLYTQSCLTVNAWNHVAVVYSATERVVYVNGVEIAKDTISGTFNKRSSLDIGYGSTTTRSFNGKIADFRIYRTSLKKEDIFELYESKAAIDKNQNVFSDEIIEQNNSNMTNTNSWETGAINDASGTENNQSNLLSTRIRSKYIPVLPNTKYYFAVKEKCKVRQVYYYTKDLAFIGIVGGGEQTTPSDCYFVRWVLKPKNDSDTIDVKDIALYEPSMTPCNMNVIPSFGINTDVQVTKVYQLKTKDICENHDVGFFKDGTTSGNNFYEI